MSDEATYQHLRDAIEDLEKNIGRYDKGSCEITVLEVLKDKQVQMAFIKEYVSHENVFQSVSCKGQHDQIKVTFIFECKPPRICIIHHSIIVTYDLSLHKVVGVEHFP